jgi:hypothetical protein
MKNLAMSQIMAGANFWDAPGHSMAGSNDLATRKQIFSWIQAHERTFFRPRTPMHPVGVYFSPETRNFYADEFIRSYRGILLVLMQNHMEFQVVTPRTLADFKGKSLVLPDVRILSSAEKDLLAKYASGGNTVVITGNDATGLGTQANVVRLSPCPGKAYMRSAEQDFDHADPHQEQQLLKSVAPDTTISIAAGPLVATSMATVDGAPHIFFANFTGLVGGVNPVQTPQENIQVIIPAGKGTAGHFLPFLGEEQEVHGTSGGGHMTYTLPSISKGAVFWWDEQ